MTGESRPNAKDERESHEPMACAISSLHLEGTMKTIGLTILFAVIGLGVGYLIFGQVHGHYIDIESLFSTPSGFVENIAYAALGVGKIRQHILISGVVGAIVGLFLGMMSSRKKAQAGA
ncbi:MAG: hypothetical protein D6723_15375 [Acidobacteria bacterium]|nr:MAG: hypothetical protein D6723_15375 [Acidobacteriota bacterium]